MNDYGAFVEWHWQGKTEVLGDKLSQCHIIHNKSCTSWPGIEPVPQRWESERILMEISDEYAMWTELFHIPYFFLLIGTIILFLDCRQFLVQITNYELSSSLSFFILLVLCIFVQSVYPPKTHIMRYNLHLSLKNLLHISVPSFHLPSLYSFVLLNAWGWHLAAETCRMSLRSYV